MADPRFYVSRGPFAIGEIARLAQARLPADIDGQYVLLDDVAALDRAAPGQLTFCERPKYGKLLAVTGASACFLTEAMAALAPKNVVALVTPTPQIAFCAAASAFYPDAGSVWDARTPSLSSIDPSAHIGADVVIAPGVFIAAGVEIGAGTIVGPGAVIGRGVQIGMNCRIGPQATISHALIGDRVSIFAGARIGCDGFGFAPGPRGLVKIPQLGRVILQDDVEIGANVTIDRGALGDTTLGEGTKLDNMVHIGHNVTVGRMCVIAAQTGISGSVTIGDFVMMGGQVGVADHVVIGDKTQLAGRAGVTRGLPGGQAYGGFPARPVRVWRREVAALARLADRRIGQDHDGAD